MLENAAARMTPADRAKTPGTPNENTAKKAPTMPQKKNPPAGQETDRAEKLAMLLDSAA